MHPTVRGLGVILGARVVTARVDDEGTAAALAKAAVLLVCVPGLLHYLDEGDPAWVCGLLASVLRRSR